MGPPKKGEYSDLLFRNWFLDFVSKIIFKKSSVNVGDNRKIGVKQDYLHLFLKPKSTPKLCREKIVQNTVLIMNGLIKLLCDFKEHLQLRMPRGTQGTCSPRSPAVFPHPVPGDQNLEPRPPDSNYFDNFVLFLDLEKCVIPTVSGCL